jgi:hypothetical protein
MTEIARMDKFSIRENKGRYYVYYIDRSKPKLSLRLPLREGNRNLY